MKLAALALVAAMTLLAAPALGQDQAQPGTTSEPVAERPGGTAAETAPKTPDEGEEGEDRGPRKATVKLRLKGLSGGRLTAGKRVLAAGTLRPFAKGAKVTLRLTRGKKTVKRKTVFAKQKKRGSNLGQFSLSKKIVRPGRYAVQAIHKRSSRLTGAKDRTRSFRIRYPNLNPGNRGASVKLFNRLLARLGYVNDRGRNYNAATGRAVLAFHKVNKKRRTSNATAKDFKRLAKGKGGYRLRYPFSGKHVEADLSRQVMVLANGGKVKGIYHVSTGAPATPTRVGSWRFYRKEPGFNNVGMYYSVYYSGGYAIHGYRSVPTYPASHGCLRNPIPNSRHIYNWVSIGDPIHIYR
jgi:lipoprotein-anchoring transpeptidase ErfK/SrfK